MANIVNLKSIAKKYERNEDENAHSENVVLLAQNFGTKEELAEAKAILKKHNEEGHLSSENGAKRQKLHSQLIAKARVEMNKQGIQFRKGGKTDDKPKEPKGKKMVKTKEPKIVRGFFDDEPYEYAKGGGVDYYEQLAVYVQGVGSIYNGTSMRKAIEKARAYEKKKPNAEIIIVDEKYGDEYDTDGNFKNEFAKGGAIYKGDKVKIKDTNKSMVVKNIVKGKKGYVEFSGDGGTFLKGDLEKYEKGGKMDEKPKAPKGKKAVKPKEPKIVRGFFDDEPYEYAKGGSTGSWCYEIGGL